MKTDFYRIFFPVGWFLGFWGALVWVLFKFNLINYPGVLHPEIMMGGFLLSFVFGFLGTAAPRFTASFPPTISEIYVSLLLIINLLVSQFIQHEIYFRLSSLSIFIFLIIFLIARFVSRQSNPPMPFVFVGIGVVVGTLGSLFLLLFNIHIVGEKINQLGRLFFFQGYILSFVIGVGSRLIPSLLGHSGRPDEVRVDSKLSTYLSLGFLFFISYFIEVYFNKLIGSSLRSLILLFVGIFIWKLYKMPKVKSVLTFGLWLSCVFLIIGHVSANLWEVYSIHLMHLFYISGLSLMTILVASRVTLSHGGHDLILEKKSKILIATISLFILAALTRVSAGILPDVYINHLAYAALVWIIGLCLWGHVFLKKIIFLNK